MHLSSQNGIVVYSEKDNISNQSTNIGDTCATANIKSKCFLCGGSRHDRKVYATRNATCFKCKKQGHFFKMLRSNPQMSSASTCPHRLSIIVMKMNPTSASSGSLKQASIYVFIGKKGSYHPIGYWKLWVLYVTLLFQEAQTTDEA